MIDRSKTLTMISRNKKVMRAKHSNQGSQRVPPFPLLISTLGRTIRRDGIGIISRIRIPYSCLVLCCLQLLKHTDEGLPLIYSLPYFKSHKGKDEPFDTWQFFQWVSDEDSPAAITDCGPSLSAQLAPYAKHDGAAKFLSLLGQPTFYEANQK